MKKISVILLTSVALFGGIYSNSYSVNPDTQQANSPVQEHFMYGDFEEIIRFEALYVDGQELEDDSQEIHKAILEKIEVLQDAKKEFEITLMGHTSSSDETSAQSMEFIAKTFLDANVSQSQIFQEERKNSEDLYIAGEQEKNERVMVSIYVLEPKEKVREIVPQSDSDLDGVFDKDDKCPNTPKGHLVDEQGCSLDTDKDGVTDSLDQCPDTPLDAPVDEVGCLLDSDLDGVFDYKDACPGTISGVKVDAKGCSIFKALKLNFKVNSYEVLADSMPKVVDFATFMKAYPAYKAQIVGHTDSTGKEDANMKLSLARAGELKRLLVLNGVEASRLDVSGRGELEPIADNRSKEGRKENRRIEIKLFE